MKTEVILKRNLLNGEISQNSKTEYFSATDLIKIGNDYRFKKGLSLFNLSQWISKESTKEFSETIKKSINQETIIKSRGRNSVTWVHPYIFIDLALAISPDLKFEVYEWIYDSLVKYRNDSGDSYKKMAGALYLTCSNKSLFKNEIIDIANKIRIECDVIDWNEASEYQLKLRDKIHEYIALFSDIIRERNNLFDISVKKAKKELEKTSFVE